MPLSYIIHSPIYSCQLRFVQSTRVLWEYGVLHRLYPYSRDNQCVISTCLFFTILSFIMLYITVISLFLFFSILKNVLDEDSVSDIAIASPKKSISFSQGGQSYLMVVRRSHSAFFHIDGYSSLKNDLTRKYGLSFHFWKTNLSSYPNIDYGEPVQVIHAPSLEQLPSLDYLTLMLSRPCEGVLRQIVRNNTRETQHQHGFHTVFVLASSNDSSCKEMIDKESREYGDILQFNHPDGYHFITLSVFHSLQYIQKLNLPVKYIVKTDSDCVINYKMLQKRIGALAVARQNELYMGWCCYNNTYNYMRSSARNYVPKALIRDNTNIPYYAFGGCYVISYHILPRLLLAIQHLPFIAHNEDVNVGKGMAMLGIPCIRQYTWITLYGCKNETDCLKYVVMHPRESIQETSRFYSYLTSFNNTVD